MTKDLLPYGVIRHGSVYCQYFFEEYERVLSPGASVVYRTLLNDALRRSDEAAIAKSTTRSVRTLARMTGMPPGRVRRYLREIDWLMMVSANPGYANTFMFVPTVVEAPVAPARLAPVIPINAYRRLVPQRRQGGGAA